MTLDFAQLYKGHHSMIFALCHQGAHFYSGSSDGWLVEWTLGETTGKLIAKLGEAILKITPDTDEPSVLWIGTLEGNLVRLELKNGTFIKKHLIKGGVFAILSEPRQIILSGNGGIVMKVDAEHLTPLQAIQISTIRARCLAIFNGKLLAGTSEGRLVELEIGNLSITNQYDDLHQESIFSIACTDSLIYTGGKDGKINVLDINFNLVSTTEAHNITIYKLVYDEAHQLLFSACRDSNIRIWDATDMTLLKSIGKFYHEGHLRSVNDLILYNHLLISCSDDKTIRSWKLGD